MSHRYQARRGAACGGPLALVVLALTAGLVGCGADRPVEVTAIQVGRSINSDKTIGEHTSNFRPQDTIYAAVIVEGSGSTATIKARWTYGAGTISESEKVVSPRDRAVELFELRNSGGFPQGDYKLEIFLDGRSVGVRDLRVEA
jgi:hypothetical protein